MIIKLTETVTDNKIYVNSDKIVYMARYGDSTSIEIGIEYQIKVKETPEEIAQTINL